MERNHRTVTKENRNTCQLSMLNVMWLTLSILTNAITQLINIWYRSWSSNFERLAFVYVVTGESGIWFIQDFFHVIIAPKLNSFQSLMHHLVVCLLLKNSNTWLSLYLIFTKFSIKDSSNANNHYSHCTQPVVLNTSLFKFFFFLNLIMRQWRHNDHMLCLLKRKVSFLWPWLIRIRSNSITSVLLSSGSDGERDLFYVAITLFAIAMFYYWVLTNNQIINWTTP